MEECDQQGLRLSSGLGGAGPQFLTSAVFLFPKSLA